MSQNPQSSPALDAYKQIIDQLVAETRPSNAAEAVVAEGRYSNAPAEKALNAFVASLSSAQRKLLAQMLDEERHAAIHDVLALFTWWIECADVSLTVNGESVFPPGSAPVGVFGTGLHGDYVVRTQGHGWDGEDEPARE